MPHYQTRSVTKQALEQADQHADHVRALRDLSALAIDLATQQPTPASSNTDLPSTYHTPVLSNFPTQFISHSAPTNLAQFHEQADSTVSGSTHSYYQTTYGADNPSSSDDETRYATVGKPHESYHADSPDARWLPHHGDGLLLPSPRPEGGPTTSDRTSRDTPWQTSATGGEPVKEIAPHPLKPTSRPASASRNAARIFGGLTEKVYDAVWNDIQRQKREAEAAQQFQPSNAQHEQPASSTSAPYRAHSLASIIDTSPRYKELCQSLQKDNTQQVSITENYEVNVLPGANTSTPASTPHRAPENTQASAFRRLARRLTYDIQTTSCPDLAAPSSTPRDIARHCTDQNFSPYTRERCEPDTKGGPSPTQRGDTLYPLANLRELQQQYDYIASLSNRPPVSAPKTVQESLLTIEYHITHKQPLFDTYEPCDIKNLLEQAHYAPEAAAAFPHAFQFFETIACISTQFVDDAPVTNIIQTLLYCPGLTTFFSSIEGKEALVEVISAGLAAGKSPIRIGLALAKADLDNLSNLSSPRTPSPWSDDSWYESTVANESEPEHCLDEYWENPSCLDLLSAEEREILTREYLQQLEASIYTYTAHQAQRYHEEVERQERTAICEVYPDHNRRHSISSVSELYRNPSEVTEYRITLDDIRWTEEHILNSSLHDPDVYYHYHLTAWSCPKNLNTNHGRFAGQTPQQTSGPCSPWPWSWSWSRPAGSRPWCSTPWLTHEPFAGSGTSQCLGATASYGGPTASGGVAEY